MFTGAARGKDGMHGCSHGGIYSVDKRLVKVDCSSSVNPLGPPRAVIDTIKREAERLVPQYPDSECRELKARISPYVQCSEDQICVGNGALEIIHIFARLYAKARAVIPAPTFCEYENATQRAGASATIVPMTGGWLDADSFIDNSRGADAVFLCNPNNPTGLLLTDSITKVIKSIDPTTMILLDECFIELSDRPDDSLVAMIKEFDNLVVLRSLTKSFGLAGLRIGYSVSNASIARKLQSIQVHWSVNSLAQAAGVAALQDARKYLEKTRTTIKQERKFLYREIAKMNQFTPMQSNVNYFLIKTPSWDSTRLRDSLLNGSGVLVRDCSTFTCMDNHYIRVAVKGRQQNKRLLDAMVSVNA